MKPWTKVYSSIGRCYSLDGGIVALIWLFLYKTGYLLLAE